MITIVYCHPYDKSFNHTILNEIIRKLADNGRDYTVINLYDDKFDPVLGVNELALYSSGTPISEDAHRDRATHIHIPHLVGHDAGHAQRVYRQDFSQRYHI